MPMAGIDDQTKRRFVRKLKRRRRSAVVLGQQADQKIEQLLIRRFDRLVSVRRFVSLWILLFLVLIMAGILQLRGLSAYYQSLQPVPGGLYTEGIIGNYTDANPLYATGTADTAVSRLVFSGLFKYDNKNQLVGDLASDYTLSGTQTTYLVHLRHGLKWHDGQPVTADDVVYTYKTIQNIEAQSPLYSSWQGIKVSKADNYTVDFGLPNALSAFPYSLTNGIVPAHLLKNIPPEQLRSVAFNTAPVGTGPFIWRFTDVTGNSTDSREQRISFAANKNYQGGAPKLDGFNLITFSDETHMVSAFSGKQINAMSGLESLPDNLKEDKSVEVYSIPLNTAVMAFFNNSRVPLNDASVRRALVESVDRSQLNNLLGQPVEPVNSPLLKGQLGYDSAQTEPAYNLADANAVLDAAGWAKKPDGTRQKGTQPLTFTLNAADTPSYTKVAQYLQNQWGQIGAKVIPNYSDNQDLQSSIVGNHDYDVLLDGINIGVDPDVYAYWDSTQASITSQGHLNLSEYKNSTVDLAIEGARTRADPAIRAVKYKAFLTQWMKDLPALGLYQPNYIYITRGPVFNYERKSANTAADRYYNAHNWEIRQKKQTLK
jgi:peptide/nickel transport system substrate-binding protein